MASESHSVQFAGGNLGGQHHICAFFNSAEEEHRVLRSFFKDGFDRGDKAFHLVNPELREDHLKPLAEAGINWQETIEPGQLEGRPAGGYAERRFLGHMEWALVDLPGVEDLIEFETRVNYVVPKYNDIVICAYDLSKFSASVVMDALRTHPAVIVGGLLQENPFFIPPDQFLLEIKERRPLRRSAGMAN